jgi:hypothetical protein
MKSIPQISHNQRLRRDDHARPGNRRLLPTDFNYRPTAETQLGSSAGQPPIKPPAFHELSSQFLAAETKRDYFAELSFFILITCLAAWPIMSMLVAVVRMIRNY